MAYHDYDALGREILDLVKSKGLRNLIAVTDKPTGTVQVELDDRGVPAYSIMEDVAWDNIPFTPEMEELAKRADATRARCPVGVFFLSARVCRSVLTLQNTQYIQCLCRPFRRPRADTLRSRTYNRSHSRYFRTGWPRQAVPVLHLRRFPM